MKNLSKTLIRYNTRQRRKKQIRKKIFGTPERPRLVVYRSIKHIYAQIIDDTKGKTLVSASTIAKGVEIDTHKKKVDQSFQVGLQIGNKAKEIGITKVSFDNHGRIKALADGARKAGIKF